eukprot:6172890-Pleurochrysis_carterae.AAC.3
MAARVRLCGCVRLRLRLPPGQSTARGSTRARGSAPWARRSAAQVRAVTAGTPDRMGRKIGMMRKAESHARSSLLAADSVARECHGNHCVLHAKLVVALGVHSRRRP